MGLHVFGPGRLRLHFDDNDAETPCMVYVDKHSATYFCALDTGEMDCGAGPDLTPAQLEFLAKYEDQANEHFTRVRTKAGW